MIALWKGKSLLSRLIRFRTWDAYSHASWIDENDNDANVEAWWPGGVRRNRSIHENHTPGTQVDFYKVDLAEEETEALNDFFNRQMGKPYDVAGVLRFISREKAAARLPKMWFCSRLIFEGFNYIGKPLLLRIPSYKVYPGLLAYSPLLRHVGGTITRKVW